mmetsp:Transcript_173/g.451  ORF Transcript_173/g.451 Transcript_173/m.451 type:complete len:103 (+) Transcript_173:185-493(+)
MWSPTRAVQTRCGEGLLFVLCGLQQQLSCHPVMSDNIERHQLPKVIFCDAHEIAFRQLEKPSCQRCVEAFNGLLQDGLSKLCVQKRQHATRSQERRVGPDHH